MSSNNTKKFDAKQIGKFVVAGAGASVAAAIASNMLLPILLGDELGKKVEANRKANVSDTTGFSDEQQKTYQQRWAFALLIVSAGLAFVANKALKGKKGANELKFGAWAGLGLPTLIGLAALANKKDDVKKYVAFLNGPDLPTVEINGAANGLAGDVVARIPADQISDYMQAVRSHEMNGPQRPVVKIVPSRRPSVANREDASLPVVDIL